MVQCFVCFSGVHAIHCYIMKLHPYTLSMGSTAFGRASQSYQPEQPPLMEDSDDDMITGQGRIETPKRQSRMSVHSDNWDE